VLFNSKTIFCLTVTEMNELQTFRSDSTNFNPIPASTVMARRAILLWFTTEGATNSMAPGSGWSPSTLSTRIFMGQGASSSSSVAEKVIPKYRASFVLCGQRYGSTRV
jgi:hypothetical protein